MSAAVFLAAIGRMTLRGSIVILILLAARLLLKKAPRGFVCALWLLVLFRLLCPVSIASPVGIVPVLPVDDPAAADELLPPISFELPADPSESAAYAPGAAVSVRHEIPPTVYLMVLWSLGFLVLALRGIISLVKLRRQLRTAIPIGENIYEAEGIESPFTLGLLRPRIYLPAGLSDTAQSCILLHEENHIRSLDTLWKLLGYLALCLHWFDPLVWLACAMAGRDMELRCDEAVLRKLGPDIRADYAQTILSFAAGVRPVTAFPAFADGDPIARIRSIARWKKPKLPAIAAAALVCLALAVGLLPDARAAQKADSILSLGCTGSYDTADYILELGSSVHSGMLELELWQNGQCTEFGGMTISEDTAQLHLTLKVDPAASRAAVVFSDGGTRGETAVDLPASPRGWSGAIACAKNVRFSVAPDESYVLAALVCDYGHGLRVFGCEELTQQPEYLQREECLLLIRLTLSGEAEFPFADRTEAMLP